jgi:hypothetical protein
MKSVARGFVRKKHKITRNMSIHGYKRCSVVFVESPMNVACSCAFSCSLLWH